MATPIVHGRRSNPLRAGGDLGAVCVNSCMTVLRALSFEEHWQWDINRSIVEAKTVPYHVIPKSASGR